MNLSVGIVGLPNVGKSTLFNALLKQQAALAANYPFATIEPNVGVVPVPDQRLAVLAEVVGTQVIKPAMVEFVDIAGLVKGASQGEGLGNQFLAHIRETVAICHVVRVFDNADIVREGAVDPETDLATIRTELKLADLATLQKQPEPKGQTQSAVKDRWQAVSQLREWLDQDAMIGDLLAKQTSGTAATNALITTARELCLLTAKPELFVLNVSEAQLQAAAASGANGPDVLAAEWAQRLRVPVESVIVMCNQVESELSSLGPEDQALYLAELGLESSGLERLVVAAYQVLQLQSYLTAGEKEVRAWTIRQGTKAPQAAGVIHTDFEKKFIMAKVASYQDFLQYRGWKGLREVGKVRQEGREYVMQEGDVVEFAVGA